MKHLKKTDAILDEFKEQIIEEFELDADGWCIDLIDKLSV